MPKKIEITLDLHKHDMFLLLDFTDIIGLVPETDSNNAKFILYIDKWCQYLNRTVTDNPDMSFGNPELARLDGWIVGYGTAKGYTVDETTNKSYVIIEAGKYTVRLAKPHEVKE